MIHRETFPDGVSLLEVAPPNSRVHIQFWAGKWTAGEFSVADLENYVNSVHEDGTCVKVVLSVALVIAV